MLTGAIEQSEQGRHPRPAPVLHDASIALIAAGLLSVVVSYERTGFSQILLGYAICLVGLLALARATALRPVIGLALWGAFYVPLSGFWLLPSIDGVFAQIGVVLSLSALGAGFYGSAAILLFALRDLLGKELSALRQPLLIRSVFLGCSVGLAEWAAAQCQLVLAPLGLLAVDGGIAWFIAGTGVFGSSAILVILGTLTAATRSGSVIFQYTAGLSVFVLAALPAPEVQAMPDISILTVAHNPDPDTKWLPQGAAGNLKQLKFQSANSNADLVVWPENAVTHSFTLNQIVDDPPLPGQVHLFGMTRFKAENAPALLNSAVLIGGTRVQASDKEILAPVMERALPFASMVDLVPGTRRMLFLEDGTKILPIICYEAAFPISRADTDLEPDIIIILAADTGFWAPVAKAQGARHALARALETGIPTLRVSDWSGKNRE